MNEDRILDKLDGLDDKTTNVLVEIAKIQEQVRDVPQLRERITALERWKWTTMGALGVSGVSLASQVYTVLKGA